jgi:eukaryotic-like serine/threonine-protein kinase
MGEVYEAKHARLPGRFAVKVLAARVGVGSPSFRRFRREAEIASSLRHPNLVQVVDFNLMTDGCPYLVMEFLDGSDLSQELERVGRLSPRRTANIVGQVAGALNHAHLSGVVHRDLKPQNVFLVPFGARGSDFVKVVDFGISKVNTAATVTTEPSLIGTPQYMSPEQARGRSQEVDALTDQFALAAMAYEMLSGRPAFSGDNVPAILFAVTSTEPLPLGVPSLTAEVESVLRRGLAKDKGNRFRSILEFGEALERALSRLASSEPSGRGARPAIAPAAPTRPYGRVPETGTIEPAVSTARAKLGGAHRRQLLLVAGVAALASAGAAVVIRVVGRTALAPSPAVAPERTTARTGALVTPLRQADQLGGSTAERAVASASPDAGVAPRAPAPRLLSSDDPPAIAGPARTPAVVEPRRRQDRRKERDATRPVRSEIPFIDKL